MAVTTRTSAPGLLLGEWACLGILAVGPSHGFAIAQRLRPDGDVGRVWSLSRPLTYRSLDRLAARELIRVVGEEPGLAGGNRTVLAATRPGRRQLDRWLATPVVHLRDLRSELLLKLVIGQLTGTDTSSLVAAQLELVRGLAAGYDTRAGDDPAHDAGSAVTSAAIDVIGLWRAESSHAALRFLERVAALGIVGTSRSET